MATDKNKHLDCVLNSHKISKEQTLLDKHIAKAKKVREDLQEKFGIEMYGPFNSGSYAKNAAVNTKFDFDLMVPFKRNSFDTLEKMFNDVFDFLSVKYKGIARVRKQKVSIGIEFNDNGDLIKIDVVPGRELVQDKFDTDKRLNLYVYEMFGKIQKGSDHLLTNVHAQIENIKDRATKEKDSIRKVIRLLKIWKIGRGNGPKSFFIELITIKAFDSKTITGDLWEILKTVLEYIKDNAKTVSLPDPGNGGNDVADTLTDSEKSLLSDDMKLLLDRIKESDDNIKLYFKVNHKHPCEDKDDSTYGIKKEGISKPPVTRFG